MKTRFTLHYVLVAACFFLIATVAFSQPTFINKIPIPPLLDAADGPIELEVRQLTHKFNPGDLSNTSLNDTLNGYSGQTGITTWAYNKAGDTTMTILGPTLKWHTGDSVHIRVKNLLTEDPPAPTTLTTITTHWHGAEVPAYLDGGPHQPIEVDSVWPVDFLNLDNASTLWFHPHYHNNTIDQVSMGLSGMIISEQASDPIRPVLPHTYGVDDIPVIIGDVGFIRQIDTILNDTISIIRTEKGGKRPINFVNGVTNPYVEVPNALVRLRILNGSTRKGLQIGVSKSYSGNDLEDFTLTATDGGYTLKPDTLKSLLNGPGGRDEIIVDLSNYNPGDSLYLRNLKHLLDSFIVGSPYAAPNGGGKDSTGGNAFLMLKVVSGDSLSMLPGSSYFPITTFTPFISDWDPSLQDTSDVDRHRTKNLIFTPANPPTVPENAFTIDGITYLITYINDTVCVGAKEIWTIHNQTSVAHPFHIHKIFFRILDIVDAAGDTVLLEPRGLNGPKDDVLVLPGWKLRFMAKFDDFPTSIAYDSTYMYHCHILTHEDILGGGMMHQFVVTDQGPCAPVAVNEPELSEDTFMLYPNPASGELFMRARSAKASTVRIVDLQGRLLKEQQLPAIYDRVSIDIDGIMPGFYIVNWRTDKGEFAQKLIIQ